MPVAPSELAATTSAPPFLSSHNETALCSSLTETHTLHSYCKQTLRHGKLQHALAGSMLGSSEPRLASRRPWRYFRVDHCSSGRARPTHIGGLEVWVNHHENRPISHISAGLNARKRMSSPRVLVHRVGAPRELRPPIQYQKGPPDSLCPCLPPNSSNLTTKRLSAAL